MESTFSDRVMARRARSEASEDRHDLVQDNEAGRLSGEYTAFKEGRDGEIGIDFILANGTWEFIEYSYRVKNVRTHHKALAILYNFCLIEIKGQNLDELYKKLNVRRVTEITEFHSKYHQKPPPSDALVESITITNVGDLMNQVTDRKQAEA